MSEHTPFLEIFPGCADLAAFSGGLDKAYVTDVQVDASELTMMSRRGSRRCRPQPSFRP